MRIWQICRRNSRENSDKVVMKRIYISDLDGTLLCNDAAISEYSRAGLVKLLDSGVNFTVASARSATSIKNIFGDLPFKLPIIAVNGAYISDYSTGGHIVINSIGREIAGEIYSEILKHGCMPFVSSFNGSEDRVYYQHTINEGMRWLIEDVSERYGKRLRQTDNLKYTLAEQVACMTVIAEYEIVRDLTDNLEGRFGKELQMHFFQNPYSPQWHWLTIHDKKACKALAINTLLEMEGFSSDELTVFGDNLNDVNMFKMAEVAIAVENATEEIKGYADKIIGSNESDSVVKYITEAETI